MATTVATIDVGGTGATTAAGALTALGAAPIAAYAQANSAYTAANNASTSANNAVLKAGDTMTGALALSAGNSAAPSIRNSNSTNTGIFFANTAEVAIVSNGTIAAAFSGTSFLYRNRIINGNMRIDQRAQTASNLTGGGVYFADRFFSQAQNVSVQGSRTTEVPAGMGFTDSVKFVVNNPNSNNSYGCYHTTRVEGNDLVSLGIIEPGGATLSFWVRSSNTGNNTVTLHTGYRGGVTYNVAHVVVPYTINAANTWEFKSIYVPSANSLNSSSWNTNTSIGLEITWNVGVGNTFPGIRSDPLNTWTALNTTSYRDGSTGNTNNTWGLANNNYWQITGVQLEAGSVATPFERRPYGTELMLCQRYYQFIGGTVNSFPLLGGYIGNEVLRVPIVFPVQMRAAPTLAKNGTWNCVGIGQPSANYINNQGFSIEATGTGGGFYIHPNSTDDTFTMSAEL